MRRDSYGKAFLWTLQRMRPLDRRCLVFLLFVLCLVVIVLRRALIIAVSSALHAAFAVRCRRRLSSTCCFSRVLLIGHHLLRHLPVGHLLGHLLGYLLVIV